jgi:hypothetical protein
MLSLLKGAQRHWFPLEYSCAEICLELLKMGVWCKCENVVPAHQGFIIIKKRRTEDEGNELWFTKPNAVLDRWSSFPIHAAWRHFIGLQLHRDERVLRTINLVQDPDLLSQMERMKNFWNIITRRFMVTPFPSLMAHTALPRQDSVSRTRTTQMFQQRASLWQTYVETATNED